MLGLEAGKTAAANLWGITEGEGFPGLEDAMATIDWAIEARASGCRVEGFERLDDPVRAMLQGICHQCDEGKYYNALRLIAELTTELVNRQQKIHRRLERGGAA